MKLGEFTLPQGARRRRKRVGRGEGSGHGKTCCRGHNGQKSRSGAKLKPGYEGGQLPLYRRVPKFGFKNPFRVEYEVVNVATLAEKFEDGAIVGPKELMEHRLIRSNFRRVKVLGSGELDKKLTVKAHKFSRTAEEKIRKAGGAIEVM